MTTLATKPMTAEEFFAWANRPDVIVEVMSPDNRINQMLKRIGDHLSNGISVVFLVDPEGRTISIHRRGEMSTVLEVGDEMCHVAELPDFRFLVSDFFASL